MHATEFILYAGLLIFIGANFAISVVVARRSPTGVAQRAAQIALIWLVPVLGAVLCLHFVSSHESGDKSSFGPPYDSGAGGPTSCGDSFGGGDGGGD